MDQAPPRVAAPARPIAAVRARTSLREDIRLFGFTYVAGLIVFLTWLG